MDEVLTIQEAVDILKRIPIANTRELKAVCMAVDALEEKWRERWRPVMDGDGEMPPTDEDGYSDRLRDNLTRIGRLARENRALLSASFFPPSAARMPRAARSY